MYTAIHCDQTTFFELALRVFPTVIGLTVYCSLHILLAHMERQPTYLKPAVNRQPGYRWDNSQIKSTTRSAEIDHGHDGKQLFMRDYNLWNYGTNISFRGALYFLKQVLS